MSGQRLSALVFRDLGHIHGGKCQDNTFKYAITLYSYSCFAIFIGKRVGLFMNHQPAGIPQLFFIDTNLIHNFLYKLHRIEFLYMFRASSAHLQEVNDVNCTCMQPLVFSFSAGGRLVHLLRGVSP